MSDDLPSKVTRKRLQDALDKEYPGLFITPMLRLDLSKIWEWVVFDPFLRRTYFVEIFPGIRTEMFLNDLRTEIAEYGGRGGA